jgi:bifunctional oligoribonuclease and PAP phosphatase NrnA
MNDTTKQLIKLIDQSQKLLIALPQGKNDDALAAALTIKQYLTARRKSADIVCSDFSTPNNLSFIKGSEDVLPELFHLHKFTIKVDVSKAKIETLSYEVKDNWLSIYLTPTSGSVTKNDLRTLQSSFKYDLVIVLSANDLDSLGEVFFNNTDLFYSTPIVNIDHRASNEHFGSINIIDLTATSTSEIIYQIFSQLGFTTTEAIATSILTGMIASTRSFKTPNVTPATLNLASNLINLGADREKIVKNLYRTKSIATLKLWGQALTSLQVEKNIGLVWTSLTKNDFKHSGAKMSDIQELISELIGNSPEASLILILFEDETINNKIHGRLTVEKHFDALKILKNFSPRGNKRNAEFEINGLDLKTTEGKIVTEIKNNTASIVTLLN